MDFNRQPEQGRERSVLSLEEQLKPFLLNLKPKKESILNEVWRDKLLPAILMRYAGTQLHEADGIMEKLKDKSFEALTEEFLKKDQDSYQEEETQIEKIAS